MYTLDEEIKNGGFAKSSEFTIILCDKGQGILRDCITIKQLYRNKSNQKFLDMKVLQILDGEALIFVLDYFE